MLLKIYTVHNHYGFICYFINNWSCFWWQLLISKTFSIIVLTFLKIHRPPMYFLVFCQVKRRKKLYIWQKFHNYCGHYIIYNFVLTSFVLSLNTAPKKRIMNFKFKFKSLPFRCSILTCTLLSLLNKSVNPKFLFWIHSHEPNNIQHWMTNELNVQNCITRLVFVLKIL